MLNTPPTPHLRCSQGIARSPCPPEAALTILNRPSFRPERSAAPVIAKSTAVSCDEAISNLADVSTSQPEKSRPCRQPLPRDHHHLFQDRNTVALQR
jgi:hypothetical protein